jgi:peptidoglycan-associated lipoprotein
MSRRSLALLTSVSLLTIAVACGGQKPPVAIPTPPPPAVTTPPATSTRPPVEAPPPAPPPIPVPPEPSSSISSTDLNSQPIDQINKSEALKPAFFLYDSDQLDDAAQKALAANVQILKQYGNWKITIEGHCDERGTAEYNLALGEQRALAAKSYVVSLGIAADRITTVSYGKEFPFDPGKDDSALSKNRRAHFLVTAK